VLSVLGAGTGLVAAIRVLPQKMERAQAQLEREWLDRLGTVAGRADELCRYDTLFGDPRLAFTTVRRLLDVTAEEVQEIAKARLRPDNRAVLVYEPVAAESEDLEAAATEAAAPAETTDENEESAQ
jgi:predicted Zn-dependent peptidase